MPHEKYNLTLRTTFSKFFRLLLQHLMSDGDEGDSEAAAEEQDEPSGQAVTVVDPERQVLETEIDQTILNISK
jgi:hypothetical protein